MTELYIPPSPNWYCTHASDLSKEGLLAYGTRNRLQILNFKEVFHQNDDEDSSVQDNQRRRPENLVNFEAHTERVTSVVFSKCNPRRFVTGSDDGFVRVWEIGQDDKVESVLEHTGHSAEKVLCVDWSSLVDDLIFSGVESGTIIIWSYNSKNQPLKTLAPEKGQVTCLASSPHNERYLAIGYQTSLVVLMDLGRGGHILHRLRGHDDDIQCLCWSPFTDEGFLKYASAGETVPTVVDDPDDYFSEPVKPESGMILTSSRDRTIRLWSLTTGKQLQLHRLPVNTGHRNKDNYSEQKSRVWVTLHWIENRPHQFLSSTHGGEVLLWDLRHPNLPPGANKHSSPRWQVVDQYGKIKSHYRTLFNMTACGKYVCSIGLDRVICTWNTDTLKCVGSLPTCGGFVYCIAGSQLMPGKLALGIGDQMIRLWNTCNPANEYDVHSLWQGIKSKVTCLAFHPVKEGLLAYGTEDGRVGIYDTLANKPPFISSTFHRRTVYVVGWGPPCRDDSDECVVYSVGDGMVLGHDRKHLERDAENINDIIKKTNDLKIPKSRTEISWKPDYSVVAIGNEDGSVELFTPRNFKLLSTITVVPKLVNVIAWHPQHIPNDVTNSRYHTWLAIGSNHSDVHVCDVGDVISGGGGDVTECTRTLNFHKARVTGLSWSPHQEGLLASVSYDGIAQVWDVSRGKPLVNYTLQFTRLLSVLWNPLDPDTVYTGGEDFTVHRWSVSKQVHNQHTGALPSYTDKTADKNKHKSRSKNKRKPRVGAISVLPVERDPKTPPSLPDDVQKILDEKRAELASASVHASKKVEPKLSRETISNASDVVDNHAEEADPVKTAAAMQERQRNILERIGAKLHVQSDIPRNRNLDTIKTEATNRKRRPPALFPFCNSMECRNRTAQLDDCQLLFNAVYGKDITSHHDKLCNDVNYVHLGVYADVKPFQTMLRAEENYLLEHGRVEQYLQMQVFRGDLSKVVESAAQAGHLSDWLVAMASGSKQVPYLKACSALAAQLEREETFVKAATYHLACHQVYKAVDLLADNKHFREAVSLARLRLFRKDPKLNAVYAAWAEHYIETGSLEHAAKCYLALHDPIGAAKLLGSRTDRASLRTACDMICKLEESGFSEDGLLKDFSSRYIRQCQLDSDWQNAMQFVISQPDMKDVELELSVHQSLLESLQRMGILQQADHWQPWTPDTDMVSAQHVPAFFLGAPPDSVSLPWEPYKLVNQSFLHAALRAWLRHHHLDLSEAQYLYQVINRAPRARDTALWRQALISVSRDVTLALLAFLHEDVAAAVAHLLDALGTCYTGEHVPLLIGLCRLFLPHGPDYLQHFVAQVQELRLAMSDKHPSTPDTTIPSSVLRSVHAFYSYVTILDLRTDLLLMETYGGGADTAAEVNEDGEKVAEENGLSQDGGQNKEESSKKKRTRTDIERFLTADTVRALSDEVQQLDLAQRFHYNRVIAILDERVRTLIMSHKTRSQEASSESATDNGLDEGEIRTTAEEKVSLVGKFITIELEDHTTIGSVKLNPTLESPSVEINDQNVSFSKPVSEALASMPISANEHGDWASAEDDHVPLRHSDERAAVRPVYNDLPTQWYTLAAKERYADGKVTLAVLSQEKQYYQNMLQKLSDDIKALPCPDVVSGAEELLSMLDLAERKLTLKHDIKPAMDCIRAWLNRISTL